jgi:hypothetical protein
MYMGFTLQEFMQRARPYLEAEANILKFKYELDQVPNVTAEFNRLLAGNTRWQKVVCDNLAKTGDFGVFYLIDIEFLSAWELEKPNDLQLHLFDYGTKPVIVVRTFRKSRS